MSYTKPKTSVSATVQLTLEIKVGSNWGGDCALDQVYSQARVEAVGLINQLLSESRESVRKRIVIVGTPSIKAVAAEQTP